MTQLIRPFQIAAQYRFSIALVAVLAMLLAGSLGIGPAAAQSLNELRATGAVGEAFDGFVRARDSSVQGLAEAVNAQRRNIYVERARAQKTTVDQVGRVYAQQIFSGAPAGTWFLSEGGQWSQK